jgi:hypothetical protein
MSIVGFVLACNGIGSRSPQSIYAPRSPPSTKVNSAEDSAPTLGHHRKCSAIAFDGPRNRKGVPPTTNIYAKDDIASEKVVTQELSVQTPNVSVFNRLSYLSNDVKYA